MTVAVRFKTDENLPVSVLDQRLSGANDADLALVCVREQRVLITLDTDFADIRRYPPDQLEGVIVLRPRAQSKQSVLAMLQRVLPLLERESLPGRLWIVEDERIRIRGE